MVKTASPEGEYGTKNENTSVSLYKVVSFGEIRRSTNSECIGYNSFWISLITDFVTLNTLCSNQCVYDSSKITAQKFVCRFLFFKFFYNTNLII